MQVDLVQKSAELAQVMNEMSEMETTIMQLRSVRAVHAHLSV